MNNTHKLTPAQKRYITLLGPQICLNAYQMHIQGNGAATIGYTFDRELFKATGKSPHSYTTYGDCLINAGRILHEQQQV